MPRKAKVTQSKTAAECCAGGSPGRCRNDKDDVYPDLQSSADRVVPPSGAGLQPALPVAGDGLNVGARVDIDPWVGRSLIPQCPGLVLQPMVSQPAS